MRMSSLRAVRRLLQQTSELASSTAEDIASNREQLKQRQRKQQLAKQQHTAVDEEDIIRHQINSFLVLDGRMSSANNKKHLAATRLREGQSKDKQKRHNAKKIVGNSRSSASASVTKKHPPTFNKKRHSKQVEEKKLAKIAKMLKNAKRNKKV